MAVQARELAAAEALAAAPTTVTMPTSASGLVIEPLRGVTLEQRELFDH
jgi:hypothetical protein